MHHGYKFMDPTTGHVYLSCDVTFDESYFPFTSLSITSSPSVITEASLLPMIVPIASSSIPVMHAPSHDQLISDPPSPPPSSTHPVEENQLGDATNIDLSVANPSPEYVVDVQEPGVVPIQGLVMRSWNNIHVLRELKDGTVFYDPRKRSFAANSSSDEEPTSYEEELAHPTWRHAMHDEFSALQ